mmetsp:Transcript_31023/g.71500  ORF Transcript_31023/g.71500 Transcript_31023/m.71500 type:complete len:134 (-) Transcript_31023:275-676(-)|eukprot:CAMPEP_0114539902 /NCGR_PEP_ID=MMETSP0114-20121206/484_1 /TAXON_ID=31324 /ORGANISM="Goniomonas sp, Strain m" /LENGTH=133 /DNA_ID=CAMNT_0001724033 /DNA_START=100 /DNA_END=501 /DNA_ORIENTATION=-
MDFANYMKNRYDDTIVISGEPFPPSGFASFAAQMCTLIAMGSVFCLVFGNFIKELLPEKLKNALNFLLDNPRYLIGGFLISNIIGGQMIATGAFEVYVNSDLVYSKLQTGQLPNPEAVFGALESRGLMLSARR